jgi:ABC-type branched-subunit amino acid transport system ATPase component
VLRDASGLVMRFGGITATNNVIAAAARAAPAMR